MWGKFFSVLWGILLVTSLSGCSEINAFRDPEWSFWGYGRITEAGAVGNLAPELESVDVIALINQYTSLPGDPEKTPTCKKLADRPSAAWAASFVRDKEVDQCARERLYEAYGRFRKSTTARTDRNEIQGEILRASNQRCRVYETYLRRLQSNTNFLMGSATTTLGILGGVFTAADTARALAASAGITSGVNAEFQESFFSSVFVPVILDGIKVRRNGIYTEIFDNRGKSLEEYPLQDAISDAVRYTAACSVAEGLKEIQAKLGLSDFINQGTGLGVAKKTIGESQEISLLLKGNSEVNPRQEIALAEEKADSLLSEFKSALEKKENDKEAGTQVKAVLTAPVRDSLLEVTAEKAQLRFKRKIKNHKACGSDKLADELATLRQQYQDAQESTTKAKIYTRLTQKQAEAQRLISIDLEEDLRKFDEAFQEATRKIEKLKVKPEPTDDVSVTDSELAKAVRLILNEVDILLNNIFKNEKEDDANYSGKCSTSLPPSNS